MKNSALKLCLLFVFLFIIVSCAVITSCSDKNLSGDTLPDVSIDGIEESARTEAAEYTAPDIDYDGADVTVCSNFWGSSPWHINKYAELFSEAENGDPINDAIYRRNKKVEDELNILIGLYPIKSQNSSTEIITPILAGEQAYMFALPNGTSLPSIVSKGDMLYGLKSIPLLNLEATWWDQKSVEELKLYGVSYMATGDLCFYTFAAPVVVYFNKNIVAANNLENPYEIVRNGDWTIDKFFGMAEDAAYDIDGDGKMTKDDMYGLVCYDETNNMLYSGGVRITKRAGNNDIELIFNNERTSDILEKVTNFVHNTEVCMYASNYRGYNNVFFELLMATFNDNRALFFSQQLLVALNLRDMEADFGILPYPKYNEEQSGYYSSGNTSWQTFTVVPVTVTDLDMCGNILNSMGYYSQQLVIPAFVDTTIYHKTLRDDDSEEMLDIIFNNMVFDIAFYYNWGNVRQFVLDDVITNGQKFATVYARNEGKIQAALEKTLILLQE